MRKYQAGAVVVVVRPSTTHFGNEARARAGASVSEKMTPASRRDRPEPIRIINNHYSLEMSIQQQQSFYPNAQCSHQCQGFHATPANTPTLWGGSASSTKYPNDSSRPPTPSFPPYDVRTLHFVACGRPWLLHWRGVHTHRSWSLFWGAHVPRMVFCARASGPWQARERHRRSSRCARKSPAKPR